MPSHPIERRRSWKRVPDGKERVAKLRNEKWRKSVFSVGLKPCPRRTGAVG